MIRLRSESQPPSTSRVHVHGAGVDEERQEGAHMAYDLIQEESLQISCVTGGRSITYALECPPDEDCGDAVLREALDDQALDLDARDELDISLISIDEASWTSHLILF